MVQQGELVVGEAVPGRIDLERALREAAIGVAQVQRDDAIGIAEFLQRIEGMLASPAMVAFSPPPGMTSSGKPEPASS